MMVVPGKLSRSPRGTHHGIIVEKPQPWEWPGRSLIGPCPRERTQRNTHGRLIRAESSAELTRRLLPPQAHDHVDASDFVALRRYGNFTDRNVGRRDIHQLVPIFQIIVVVFRVVGIKI